MQYENSDKKNDESIGVKKHGSWCLWWVMTLVAGQFRKFPSFLFTQDINEMFRKYNGILRTQVRPFRTNKISNGRVIG